MKTEYWLIVLVLVVLAALGGGMGAQTHFEAQVAELAAREAELAGAQAQVAKLTECLRPPPYVLPVDPLWVSSSTGYRTDPMGGSEGERLHKGVDMAGTVGTPVRAMRAGVVAEHWPVPGMVRDGVTYRGHPVFGGYIVIDHGDGEYSTYGHLSRTDVHEGQWVAMGDVIGALGDTGVATGPHLHWEVVVDPLRYLGGE